MEREVVAGRSVTLHSSELTLLLYRSKNLYDYPLSAEDARQWLTDLLSLAQQAEAMPAPQSPQRAAITIPLP